MLNSSRVHPATFTAVVGVTAPAVLLCASPDAIVDVALFITCVRFLIHSRIDSDFGWIGRYLIQSPLHHRRHHELEYRDPAVNLSVAPVWDHLFGTWSQAGDPRARIGVDTPYRHGLWVVADVWRDTRLLENPGRPRAMTRRRRRLAAIVLPAAMPLSAVALYTPLS